MEEALFPTPCRLEGNPFLLAQAAFMIQSQVCVFQENHLSTFPPYFVRISSSPTCVSRGWLYDSVPRLQDPSFFSILYHPQADAVLHTAPSIEEFTFCHWKQRNQAEFLNRSHLLKRLLISNIPARAALLTHLLN